MGKCTRNSKWCELWNWIKMLWNRRGKLAKIWDENRLCKPLKTWRNITAEISDFLTLFFFGESIIYDAVLAVSLWILLQFTALNSTIVVAVYYRKNGWPNEKHLCFFYDSELLFPAIHCLGDEGKKRHCSVLHFRSPFGNWRWEMDQVFCPPNCHRRRAFARVRPVHKAREKKKGLL